MEELTRIFLVHENAGFALGAMSIQVEFTHLRFFVHAARVSERALVLSLWIIEWMRDMIRDVGWDMGECDKRCRGIEGRRDESRFRPK